MNNEFILQLYEAFKKYAPTYNIQCYSVPIAQAIKESAWGESELGVNAKNFFGIKYTEGRCPTCSDVYYKVGSEQNADGSYVSSNMQWCKFDSLEDCVIGYLDFLKNGYGRYDSLYGITSPELYAQTIKDCGYATSLTYTQSLINDYVDKYNLRQYDPAESENNMNNGYLIALDDGHGMETAGKRTPQISELGGRVIKENEFNRAVVEYLDIELQRCGFKTLLVAPTDENTSLAVRVLLANNSNADAYVSIHYDAYDGKFDDYDPSGNSIFHYPTSAKGKELATCIYNYLQQGTQQVKRGVKSADFYVLRKTNMVAVLSENGFMDNKEEALLMIDVDFQKEVAREHAKGLCDYFKVPYIAESVDDDTEDDAKYDTETSTLYRVQVGAYSIKTNAENMLAKLKEAGFDGFITNQ